MMPRTPVNLIACSIGGENIAGILSVNMKTPRQGLYVSSVLGILFVAPPLAIVYLTRNALLWSAVHCAVLFLYNEACVIAVSDKITRPKIMGKL